MINIQVLHMFQILPRQDRKYLKQNAGVSATECGHENLSSGYRIMMSAMNYNLMRQHHRTIKIKYLILNTLNFSTGRPG